MDQYSFPEEIYDSNKLIVMTSEAPPPIPQKKKKLRSTTSSVSDLLCIVGKFASFGKFGKLESCMICQTLYITYCVTWIYPIAKHLLSYSLYLYIMCIYTMCESV